MTNNTKDILCPMCLEGRLEYTHHHSTHLYICDVCPLVTFEYSSKQHIIDLVNYLEPTWRISPE